MANKKTVYPNSESCVRCSIETHDRFTLFQAQHGRDFGNQNDALNYLLDLAMAQNVKPSPVNEFETTRQLERNTNEYA